jgi:hypothetical protein
MDKIFILVNSFHPNAERIVLGAVVMVCEKLADCRFFLKYRDLNQLLVKGFVKKYCQSDKQTECKRKDYIKINACMPPDNMMPNGKFIVE